MRQVDGPSNHVLTRFDSIKNLQLYDKKSASVRQPFVHFIVPPFSLRVVRGCMIFAQIQNIL